jgi:hypothetical protein
MIEKRAIEQPRLTAESAEAIADHVLNTPTIPKKVPDAEDIDAQTQAVTGALASGLLTATDVPITVLQPVVADLAAQLVALGIRQTEHVDPEAIHAPAWVTDGVRQESVKVPEQPAHTEADPIVSRTAVAPPRPTHIPAHARAVRL